MFYIFSVFLCNHMKLSTDRDVYMIVVLTCSFRSWNRSRVDFLRPIWDENSYPLLLILNVEQFSIECNFSGDISFWTKNLRTVLSFHRLTEILGPTQETSRSFVNRTYSLPSWMRIFRLNNQAFSQLLTYVIADRNYSNAPFYSHALKYLFSF